MQKPLPPKPWPLLSETLPHPRHPGICQSCGVTPGCAELDLIRWQEHDEDDRPVPAVVALCRPCSGRLVGPHPRLYRALDIHEPFPGCMPLCVDCRHRDGVDCTRPEAKANGGPGVMLTLPRPSTGFRNYQDKSGRRCERITIYHGPVMACQQKETAGGGAMPFTDRSGTPLPEDATGRPVEEILNPPGPGLFDREEGPGLQAREESEDTS